jgi:hypothetical protein
MKWLLLFCALTISTMAADPLPRKHYRLSPPPLATDDTSGLWKTNKALVRAVRGTPGEVKKEGAWVVCKVGMFLSEGDSIKTPEGTTTDVFIGVNGPIIRVTENTHLTVERLQNRSAGNATEIQTRLWLHAGRILGSVRRLAKNSRYEVTCPVGILALRGGEFNMTAEGTINSVSADAAVLDRKTRKIQHITSGQSSTPQIQPGAAKRSLFEVE